MKIVDLSGQKFGSWTPQRFVGGSNSKWECVCEGGHRRELTARAIRRASFGCRECLVGSLVGTKRGRLTLLTYLGVICRRSMWRCLCECGSTKEIAEDCLLSGSTASCGCEAYSEASNRRRSVGIARALELLRPAATLAPDGTHWLIPCGSNRFAKVDAADACLARTHKWTVDERSGIPYAVTMVLSKAGRVPRKMHQLILGRRPGLVVDHINGNGLDNRRANLRHCTQAQNSRNRTGHVAKLRERGRFIGVRRTGDGAYLATLTFGGKTVRIGTFPTPELAARARDAGAVAHFGEFAALNFTEIT